MNPEINDLLARVGGCDEANRAMCQIVREIAALRAALEAMVSAAEGALPFMADALADETWYVCCGATEHTENCPLTIARADVTDQIAAARALLNSGKGVQGE